MHKHRSKRCEVSGDKLLCSLSVAPSTATRRLSPSRSQVRIVSFPRIGPNKVLVVGDHGMIYQNQVVCVIPPSLIRGKVANEDVDGKRRVKCVPVRIPISLKILTLRAN
jgi:hypothetical protein